MRAACAASFKPVGRVVDASQRLHFLPGPFSRGAHGACCRRRGGGARVWSNDLCQIDLVRPHVDCLRPEPPLPPTNESLALATDLPLELF